MQDLHRLNLDYHTLLPELGYSSCARLSNGLLLSFCSFQPCTCRRLLNQLLTKLAQLMDRSISAHVWDRPATLRSTPLRQLAALKKSLGVKYRVRELFIKAPGDLSSCSDMANSLFYGALLLLILHLLQSYPCAVAPLLEPELYLCKKVDLMAHHRLFFAPS